MLDMPLPGILYPCTENPQKDQSERGEYEVPLHVYRRPDGRKGDSLYLQQRTYWAGRGGGGEREEYISIDEDSLEMFFSSSSSTRSSSQHLLSSSHFSRRPLHLSRLQPTTIFRMFTKTVLLAAFAGLAISSPLESRQIPQNDFSLNAVAAGVANVDGAVINAKGQAFNLNDGNQRYCPECN